MFSSMVMSYDTAVMTCTLGYLQLQGLEWTYKELEVMPMKTPLIMLQKDLRLWQPKTTLDKTSRECSMAILSFLKLEL